MTQQVAVVTGTNRGIGRHCALQLAERDIHVVCTARRAELALATVAEIEQRGGSATAATLEVSNQQHVENLSQLISARFGQLDILINNAAVYLDADLTLFELDDARLQQTIDANLMGPIYLCRALMPMMIDRGYGRVVNVSSGYGALNQMGPKITAYRISKAGLNALTAVLAAEVALQNIKVNSVCPGWVRTDMGGAAADRSPEQAAADIVWAALLPNDGPSGQFLRHRQSVAW
ncbi:SDR family NAD(P)-dependent oxidoreductase [Ferrimonas lipolytica]|uniref:SDR family NAD(P)-dependent oxidoreductase n=1 Tax=Ferrimonas lipolytica TaxID=2724191 RepID=A0A6H1UC11_9GAMM|nr:SDR family NAD(P)-dependent oxidoreductase [Ferrimonas lipolytica]QIZ75903.1 SDR family NAD(P)-dependent oxidoreductase [Ferrimonas lipolytica]